MEASTICERRFSKRATVVVAIGWAIAVALVSWPAFLDNIEAYRKLGNAVYYGTIAGLFSLAAAVLVHHKLRRFSAQFEPAAVVVLVSLACFWKEPLASATIFLLANSAFAIGRFTQRRLALDTCSVAADIALCGSLGLGALILAMMALGTAGLISAWTAAILLLAPCFLLRDSLADVWRLATRMPRGWREFSAANHWLPSIAFMSFAVFGGFTLAVALTPTISADAIRYHLPSAIFYAETGSVAPVPGLSGSHLPQAIELLMALTYSLGDIAAAQFVNPLFLLLCAVLVYALTRACGFGRAAGVLAVVAGMCVPFVHWSGSVVKVDLAVPLFQLASLYCFIRGLRAKNVNWLLVGLAFLALSAGAKLTAIYGAVPLGLLHIYFFFRLVTERVRFRPAQIAALVVLVVVIAPFWQVRNYIAIGNPWYPMRSDLMTKNSPPLEGVRPGPIEAYFQYPWITHFRGRMSFEGASNNPAGVFLVLFAPVWLLMRRRRASFAERTCLFFAVLSYLYWGHMWAFLRYGIPMFLVVYCLTAGRVVEFSRRGGKGIQIGVSVGLLFSLLFSATVTARYEINLPQLKYLAGLISKRQFLVEANKDFPSVDKLNQVAEPGERTFSVDNLAVLYAPDPGLFTYAHSMIGTQWADRVQPRILKRLAERDYRYLILPARAAESFQPALSELYEMELLHEDERYLLFRIQPNLAR